MSPPTTTIQVNPFLLWLELQRKLQIEAYGHDPALLEDDERSQFMLWNAFAALDEIHEAMQEVGWKPWATSRHLNRHLFIQEIVDVLHFLGNLLICCAETMHGDFTLRGGEKSDTFVDVQGLAHELWEAYTRKVQVNLERQREGYDGVKEKCPKCRRELVLSKATGLQVCSEHGPVFP